MRGSQVLSQLPQRSQNACAIKTLPLTVFEKGHNGTTFAVDAMLARLVAPNHWTTNFVLLAILALFAIIGAQEVMNAL